MNYHLYHLISTERPGNSYYLSLRKNMGGGRNDWLRHKLKHLNIYYKAAVFPFQSRYNKPQYNGERKNRIQIIIEMLCWALKYKEVCKYYFLYGLDLKNKSTKDYVAYSEFRMLRNILNIRQRENLPTLYTYNYLALTRDKFIFYQFCKSLNIPFPKTIALVLNNQISYYDGKQMEFQKIETIKDINIDAFCKEIDGESGKGAFSLLITDGIIYVNDEVTTVENLAKVFNGKKYIIQERLINHPVIKAIYPKSLNTIRLTTFLNDNGKVEYFASILRLGTGGNVVDNASHGGMFVGIDEKGIVLDIGYIEPYKAKRLLYRRAHPDTGVNFAGIQIPFWEDILSTAKRFHKFLYGIPSIGWDIAVTSNGFYFTEAGEDWEIQLYQVPHGPLRKKFYETHGHALDIKLRKY